MSDFEKPNLFIGKIIESRLLKAEVLSFDENNLEIKVLSNPDIYMQRYVDVGLIYKMFRHTHWGPNLLLWEIHPEQMKRNYSQIILQWEKDIGWTWDMNS